MAKNNTTPRDQTMAKTKNAAPGVPAGSETVGKSRATSSGRSGPQEKRSAVAQSDTARERNATGSSPTASLEQRYASSDAPGGALAEFESDLVEAGGEVGGSDAMFPRKGAPAPPMFKSGPDVIGSHPDAVKHRAKTLDNTSANAGRPKTKDATFSRRDSRPSDPRS